LNPKKQVLFFFQPNGQTVKATGREEKKKEDSRRKENEPFFNSFNFMDIGIPDAKFLPKMWFFFSTKIVTGKGIMDLKVKKKNILFF
jgi:hypothetical protein